MEDAKRIDRDRLLPGGSSRPRADVTVAVSTGAAPITAAPLTPKGTASELVKQQAGDRELWGKCITFMEDRLQRALRDLHEVVETMDTRLHDAERIIELYGRQQTANATREQEFGTRIRDLCQTYANVHNAPPPGQDGP